MKDLARLTLLYDFYGELLTDKQRNVYEGHFFNDLSLGELANEMNISRAAIHDSLKKSEKALIAYDNKLGLVKKYLNNKEKVEKIQRLTTNSNHETILKIKELIDSLIL